VAVTHRVVFGTKAAVDQVLPVCGWQINTSFIERLNLSLRQRVAAIGRRSATPCKHEEGLHQELTLFQVYHSIVLPHASLRQALPELMPTKGRGSAKAWGPRTPVMAAGLSGLVTARGVVLSGAAVATATDGLSNGGLHDHYVERLRCAQRQTERAR
jgi:hypothetical protein